MNKNGKVIKFNNRYFLKVGNNILKCQIGSKGVKRSSEKIEGDKTTPIGKWYFESIFYRPDRVLRPKLKKRNIGKS